MSKDWQIGNRIANRWEIQKIFGGPGSSGMGIVYVVYDYESHEVFAAKTFQDGAIARDSVAVSRFNREALAWINLDRHQNITRAHAVRSIDDKPFLFLEYITGGDLAHWIGSPRLLEDLAQALRFAIQFCDGMSHAVAKGIKAHRDIKPQNCLISQDEVLKITDFGLAKVFDESPNMRIVGVEEERKKVLAKAASETQADQKLSALAPTIIDSKVALTQTGMGMGTARYMAPEQFEDAKHVDLRADIYSFGVMLFEMLTGKLPFIGQSWQEYLIMHLTHQPPPLRSHHPALDSLVETCLAKDPNQRFQDFRVVRKGLAQIFEQLTNEPAPEPTIGRELIAEEWYNKGLSLANLGHSQRAIDCYDRALQIKPSYAAAWNNKATALDLSEAAIYCLDRALAINPRWEQSWYNKGAALTKLGRAKEAFVCYDHTVEINPLNDVAWNDRGATLSELGRTDEALKSYERALAVNPANEKAWLNKGNALRNSGRPQESLSSYDHALEINPSLTEALKNKGVTLSELGQYQEALGCFDRIIEIDMQSTDAWANKGKTLRKLRRPAEALECYDRALRFTPSDADTWSDKGTALGDLGQALEALECFNHAIKLSPRHDKAWFNKGNELRKLGKLEEAVAAYDKALEFAPTLHQAWVNKGLTLTSLGRLDESLACYDSALKLNQNEPLIWFNRGNSLFQMKRAEEAIASYDRALGLDPRAAQIWNNKGAALAHGFHNFRDALQCFEKAAQLGDPNASAAVNECRRLLATR